MAGMSQRDVQRMGAVTHLCTLISEHAPDLIPSSRHSEITKAPEVMPKSSARHIALPIEVWEHIILRLDTLNLSSITQVSKELCHLTKSTSFRARYLLKHYSKSEAIYKATCHLSVVDEDLLKVSDCISIESGESADDTLLLTANARYGSYHVKTFCPVLECRVHSTAIK